MKKREIEVKINWTIPWMAGFLFTLGYSGMMLNLSFWEQLITGIFVFIFWPIILGGILSGNIHF